MVNCDLSRTQDMDRAESLETAICAVQQAIGHIGLSSEWTSVLSSKLRRPCELCPDVRRVLEKNGWVRGQFRSPPVQQMPIMDKAFSQFGWTMTAGLKGNTPSRKKKHLLVRAPMVLCTAPSAISRKRRSPSSESRWSMKMRVCPAQPFAKWQY